MLTEQEQAMVERWREFERRQPTNLEDQRSSLLKVMDGLNDDPPEIGVLQEDLELRPGVRVDIAVPKGSGPFPVMLYIHGGAWIMGSPRTHRKLGMQFAERGYLTVNLDYQLAPENPFPAGFEDCVFAARWAAANVKRWNGDPSRMALGGDSAGANLSAATLVALAGDPVAHSFRAAVLIYGLFDWEAMLTAMPDKAVLEALAMAYLGAQYPAALSDPRVSPLRGIKPAALPPTFLIVGDADGLVSEAQSMARALGRADIDHELHVIPEMPHAFMQMDLLRGCAEGHRLMFDFLARRM